MRVNAMSIIILYFINAKNNGIPGPRYASKFKS